MKDKKKFSSIVKSVTDKDVMSALKKLYPKDFKNSELGFVRAFSDLRALKPKRTKGTIELVLVEEEPPGPYVWVCMELHGEHFCLSLVPWREWLGMSVDSKIECTDAELVAHCLWEMTFWGYTQEMINAFIEDLKSDLAAASPRNA